jgi:phage N-6-adenine-methyltransferase
MSDSDSWCTPQWLFDELNAEFNFDIDLCATRENSKCLRFYKDYLNDIVDIETDLKYYQVKGYNCAFMNPPYSNPRPFIEKAWEDSKHCKIVCLVKCDPSTKWWATFWNYMDIRIKQISNAPDSITIITERTGPKPGCEVRFFPKRIKFDAPKIEPVSFEEFVAMRKRTFQTYAYEDYLYNIKKKKNSGPTFASALVIMDRRGD